MLEQSARVAVVAVGSGGGERAIERAQLGIAHEQLDERRQPGMGDLGGEELEEPVELVRVAAKRRSERRRVGVLRGLECTYLELEPAAEAFHPAQDPDGVALVEARVQQLDVAPDPRLDATARVGELHREVRGACPGAPALLLDDCEHALDRPVFAELRDRRHSSSLWS